MYLPRQLSTCFMNKMSVYGNVSLIVQCDRRFRGDMKYPLPNERAATSKIGKGGNGSVFIIYHEKKQFAVKQVCL